MDKDYGLLITLLEIHFAYFLGLLINMRLLKLISGLNSLKCFCAVMNAQSS